MVFSFRSTVLLLVLLGGPTLQNCASQPPPFQAAQSSHGNLKIIQGVWVLELWGSPQERGRAAGMLLKEQICWLLPRYLKAAFGSTDMPAHLQKKLRFFSAGIPKAHLDQLHAMADAAQVDLDQLLTANLSTEIVAGMMCSGFGIFGDKSSDGRVRLARNLDWLAAENLKDLKLVVIEKGSPHTFASLSFPGLAGAITGMNDRGLVVANLVALQQRGQPAAGIPVMFAIRTLLEETSSVDEALARLRASDRTVAQNYVLADEKSAVALETGPTHFRIRESQKSFSIITNYFNEDIHGTRDKRFERLLDAANELRLDMPGLKKAMHAVAIPGMNVQAVILEPERRLVDLSIGDIPAAAGPWVQLDLSRWLRSNNSQGSD